MSFISGTTSAILNKDSQDAATAANRDAANKTNSMNFEQFLRARGKYGDALLPMYLRTPEGKKWERFLGKGLTDTYDATMPESPSTMLERLQQIKGEYMPMRDAAVAKAGGIFNGDIEKTLMGNYEPVAEARAKMGANRTKFRRESAIQALQKTLSEIDAAQAGKGYTGDSLGSRMLTFKARKQSADDESAAKLLEDQDSVQTAMERQAIKDYAGVQLPLSSINLPAELMAQGVGLETMPQRELLDFTSARLQPLTFLRMGAGQPFQYSPMPLVPPSSNPMGLALQGAGQAGNMAADYFMKRSLAQQAQQYGPAYGPEGQMYGPAMGNGGAYYRPYSYTPMAAPQPAPAPNTSAWNYLGGGGGGYGAADDYGLGGMAY